MKKKKWIPIVVVALVVAVVVFIYLFFGLREQENKEEPDDLIASDILNAEQYDEETQSQIDELLNSTEVPEDLVSAARELKTHIKENGTLENDYYSIGYMFGDNLYCSIRYYEELNILCLYSSYYTTSNSGYSMEVLSVVENFPYSESVKYYEYYVASSDGEDGGMKLVAEAPITPEEFTVESKLEFKTTEDSAFDSEEEDLTNVFKTAEKYSVMSFSFWDEMMELEFGVKLSDFRYKEFVREDYKTISLE